MVIMYTLYLGALLALENSPLRPALERWIGAARPAAAPVAPVADPGGAESAGPPRLEDYIHGFLAFSVVYLASILLEQLVGGLVFVPQVIFLTTFAILLGAAAPHTKLAVARRLVRMSAFGEASLYFLLGIIGAQATLTESLMHAPVLLLVPTVVIAVHVLVLLPGARLLRVDLVTGAIVSIAAIGGAASAPAAVKTGLATSLKDRGSQKGGRT